MNVEEVKVYKFEITRRT